ncbi:nickel/cobalt transporter (NiCoT) family protein [Entomortierella parvispora]|uniref:Nickel/cobalt transporter (NiCoT) family protein n=1 Tax=Entomortierella parvispora TaxID=205924 RepID=A0A9P3M0K8_9FUNG|nr:nickel/cobalt transporter (NiCoT) family protein [Entomortierella parvispora]
MDATIFKQNTLQRKCLLTMGGLILVNIIVWALAGITAREYPELLGSMVVAYTLGLRHAVDADHLAAIDNVTRKLIYQGMLNKARSRAALQAQQQKEKEEEEKNAQGIAQQEQEQEQDANAIAAQEGEREQVQEEEKMVEDEDQWTPPVCVGLFFSLGHSTIVIIASIALAVTATAIKDKFAAFGDTGGIIGTSVSAGFLFLIGFINLVVLIQVGQELRRVQRTGEYHYRDPVKEMIDATAAVTDDIEANVHSEQQKEEISTEIQTKKDMDGQGLKEEDKSIDHQVNNSKFQAGGLFARIFRPLFNLIDRSWKMYPLGVLFGLGFDTATEVGLLGIAATNAQAGFPTAVILIFPALFTAGMSLIDTLDGILMVNAYGWAFVNPVKKLWYNFVVTLMGVIVAFVVGLAELLGLLAEQLDLEGPFWDFFSMLSDNFGLIGMTLLSIATLTLMMAGAIQAASVSVPFTDAQTHGEITVDVGAGTYSLLVDTASANTWIGNENPYKPGPQSKDTGSTVTVSYYGYTFTGTEYTDDVVLGTATVSLQSFGVGTAQNFQDQDGVLGLGPTRLSAGTVSSGGEIPTVADNLFKQGIITEDVFAISFQSIAGSDEVSGDITFGEVDPTKFTGDIYCIPVTDTSPASDYWGINAAFSYGDTVLLAQTAGIIDYATTALTLATNGFTAFKQQTGAAEDTVTGLLTVTDEQYAAMQPLVLQFSGGSISIPPNGLIWPRSKNSEIGGVEGTIYLVVTDHGSSSGQGFDFTIGYRVLQRFYTVFNAGTNQVGIATTSFTDSQAN